MGGLCKDSVKLLHNTVALSCADLVADLPSTEDLLAVVSDFCFENGRDVVLSDGDRTATKTKDSSCVLLCGPALDRVGRWRWTVRFNFTPVPEYADCVGVCLPGIDRAQDCCETISGC